MAGSSERESVGRLVTLQPGHFHSRYSEAVDPMMRDFWRRTSDRESRQEVHRNQSGRGNGQTSVVDFAQRLEEHSSFQPYSFMEQQTPSASVNVDSEARSCLTSSHNVYNTSSSAYTNFFNTTAYLPECHTMRPPAPPTYITTDTHRREGYSTSPFAPSCSNFSTLNCSAAHDMASEGSINRDMEKFQQELAYKCPRSSDLLLAITTSANTAVREHGSSAERRRRGNSGLFGNMSLLTEDEDDAPDAQDPEFEDNPQSEQDLELRAAIIDHPFYPEMVLAHVRVFKIGAPRRLRRKLDELAKKFQRFQDCDHTSKIGSDPELDHFMRSYVGVLTKFAEDLEEPFNKFIQFTDNTSKALEEICGHYVDTTPDEDNCGFDIGPLEYGAQEGDDLDTLGDENVMYPLDIDESVIVDPMASDEDIKKALRKKYGRHIGELKAEFNRVRKKGKLPTSARTILKDWFNRHSHWPYPSEMEKQYLQRICGLNLKQINNWFINERKRHWSCEGKCMHPNAKFYGTSNGQCRGHLE